MTTPVLLVDEVAMAEECVLFDNLCKSLKEMDLQPVYGERTTETSTALSPSGECGVTQPTREDVDGMTTPEVLKLIKSCVCIVLQHVINRMLNESCFGCEVDHPSQRQHSCLYEPVAYYYQTHIVDIKERLFKTGVLQVIVQVLKTYGLHLPTQKIFGAVEAFVYELEEEPYICEKLRNIEENLVDRQRGQFVYDTLQGLLKKK